MMEEEYKDNRDHVVESQHKQVTLPDVGPFMSGMGHEQVRAPSQADDDQVFSDNQDDESDQQDPDFVGNVAADQ